MRVSVLPLVIAIAFVSGCSQVPTKKALVADDLSTDMNPMVAIQDEFAVSDIEFIDPDCLVEPEHYATYAGPGYLNLWNRIRDGFQLDHTDNARVETYRKWYSKNTSYMRRVSQRAELYLYSIVNKLEERGLPTELALLPIVESAFDPFAYSHGRASGMWQFIPATGRRYGLERNYWYDGRRDIEAATDAALDYLTDLNKRFNGDWMLALASYNTGEGNVEKAVKRNKRAGKPTDFWSLRLPRETQNYVPQLIALSQLVMDPDKYGIELTPIDNEPYYQAVNVDSQIDLAKAAELANLEMDELYQLNPAFNQWATDPNGSHQLLIPVENVAVFKRNLKKYPPEKRLAWENYKVKSGDSLLLISKHFNTTPDVVRQVNNISGNTIQIGQELLIPVATQSANTYAFSEAQRTQRKQETSKGKPGTEKITYRVKAGDSLWAISQTYKVNVNSLAKWNNMAPRDPLKVGQKLVVWAKEDRITTVAQYKRSGSPVVRKVAYKVRQGDSLSRIASKFNLSVKDIASWNSLAGKKFIHPGQNLTLWVDVTRAR